MGLSLLSLNSSARSLYDGLMKTLLLPLLLSLTSCTPEYDAESCNELSMKKYKGIPHAHNEFEQHCQGMEIKYTPELCQKALVHLMSKNDLAQTKKKFGDPIENCFTGDDLRRFTTPPSAPQ